MGFEVPKTTLFSPTTLRSITFDNRIVVSPMGQYSAKDGHADEWHLMQLGHLAVSGAGLVFTEATTVEPRGRVSYGCLGLWDDTHVRSLQPVLDFCRRAGGAKLGMQLAHSGRKGSVTAPWEKQIGLEVSGGGWKLASASAHAYPGRPEPESLGESGLKEVLDAFVAATRRADAAGIDIIEIHNAHGYLLHSFLSPHANIREDQYGGSLENRMRFPLQVFEAVRAVWPEHKPLGVRVTCTDWTPEGWTIEDTVTFAHELKTRGCDYICASSGGTSPNQKIPVSPGYQVRFAERIRHDVNIPTMAVGLITEPDQAETILASGQADFVALGRGMVYNPRWAWHAATHFGEEVFFPPQYERAHPSMRVGDFLKSFRNRIAS
jgi:2,4-dienoyl-CoA reductase-like NADH-dependent reductase (Old Yellow Enzyme family)